MLCQSKSKVGLIYECVTFTHPALLSIMVLVSTDIAKYVSTLWHLRGMAGHKIRFTVHMCRHWCVKDHCAAELSAPWKISCQLAGLHGKKDCVRNDLMFYVCGSGISYIKRFGASIGTQVIFKKIIWSELNIFPNRDSDPSAVQKREMANENNCTDCTNIIP